MTNAQTSCAHADSQTTADSLAHCLLDCHQYDEQLRVSANSAQELLPSLNDAPRYKRLNRAHLKDSDDPLGTLQAHNHRFEFCDLHSNVERFRDVDQTSHSVRPSNHFDTSDSLNLSDRDVLTGLLQSGSRPFANSSLNNTYVALKDKTQQSFRNSRTQLLASCASLCRRIELSKILDVDLQAFDIDVGKIGRFE